MRDRERRFEELIKLPAGVLANRVIELEAKLREREAEMTRVALSLMQNINKDG